MTIQRKSYHKLNPVRKTSSKAGLGINVETVDNHSESYKREKVTEAIDNLRAARKKWQNFLDIMEYRFSNWQMDSENTPMPKELREHLSAISPERTDNGKKITHSFLRRMVRKQCSLWAIDLSAVAYSRSGFLLTDHNRLKQCLSLATAKVLPDTKKRAPSDG